MSNVGRNDGVGKPLPMPTAVPSSAALSKTTPHPSNTNVATSSFSQLLKPIPNLRERCADLLLRAKNSAAQKELCLAKVSRIMRSVEGEEGAAGESPLNANSTPVRKNRDEKMGSPNTVFAGVDSSPATFAKWEMVIDECTGTLAQHLVTANTIATKAEGCAATAERSSSSVKLLDTLHSRVKCAREIVKRISETRTCVSIIARSLSQVNLASSREDGAPVRRSTKETSHINDAIAAFARYVQSNKKLQELCCEDTSGAGNDKLPFIDYNVITEASFSLLPATEDDLEDLDGAFEPWLLLQTQSDHDRGQSNEEGDDMGNDGDMRTQRDRQEEEASLARSIASRAQKFLLFEVGRRLEHAMTGGNRDEVLVCVEALASIGSHNETMKSFIQWVCSVSLAELSSLVDNELGQLKTSKNTEKSHLYSSSVALDHVVATLEREEEFVIGVFGNDGFIELLRHLHKRCTQHVARVIEDYLVTQHHLTSGPSVVPKDLDRTLEEISHLVSCCQMYMQYVDGRYKDAVAHKGQEGNGISEGVSAPLVSSDKAATSRANSSKLAAFVTEDNPLFGAIQKLLEVFIPMQQTYFKAAISQTLENELFGIQDFQEGELKRLESIAKDNGITTKKNTNTATTGAGRSVAPFSFVSASNTASASHQVLLGHLNYLLQAAVNASPSAGGTAAARLNNAATGGGANWFGSRDGASSFSPFDGPGDSPGQSSDLLRLTQGILAATSVSSGSGKNGGIRQVLQSEIPDVTFVDDMFYVLRNALFRAFTTKNPSITTAVILTILNTINDEIAKEVIEVRLGGQLLPAGSFPRTSTSQSKSGKETTNKKLSPQHKAHGAVYFFDDVVESYFETLLARNSNTTSSYSNLQAAALSPTFMKWLLAAVQIPSYIRRLAGDIQKAASAAYGGNHDAPGNAAELKKLSEIQHNFEDLANCLQQNVDHIVFLSAGLAAKMLLLPIQTVLSPLALSPMYLSPVTTAAFQLTPDAVQRSFKYSSDGGNPTSAASAFIDPISGLASAISSDGGTSASASSVSSQNWLESVSPQWRAVCEYIRVHVMVRNEELYERLMTHLVGWFATQFEVNFLLPLVPRNWLAAAIPHDGAPVTNEQLEGVVNAFVGRYIDMDGALQLDEDIRSLKTFFIDSLEVPVREKFGRLTAISSLVVVDNIRDAVEVSATVACLSRVDKSRLLVGKPELKREEVLQALL